MSCNCAGRARRLLGWLGYCQHPEFIAYNGTLGTVVFGNYLVERRHFVVTISAIISRIALGPQRRPCAVATGKQED